MGSRPLIVQVASADYSFRVHLLPLVEALHHAGVDVICCGPGGSHVARASNALRYLEVPLCRSANPIRQFFSLVALVKALRRLDVDLLHTHTAAAGLIGRIAARCLHVRSVVHTIHGLHNKSRNPVAAYLFEAFERWGAARSDHLFVQNVEDLERVRGWRVLPRHKVTNIANGINLSHFDPSLVNPTASLKLRQSLGIPRNAVVVCFIGRPTREKGAADVLSLAARDDLRAKGVFFLCVVPEVRGDDRSLRQPFASKAGELPLVALDFRDDVRDLLGLSDIFLLPSRFEGLSKSIIEAAAMGLPIITTDVRGCRDLVEHGRTGYLVKPGECERMAALIIQLANDPEQRREMGALARRDVVGRYDQGRFIANQVDVITSLLAAR